MGTHTCCLNYFIDADLWETLKQRLQNVGPKEDENTKDLMNKQTQKRENSDNNNLPVQTIPRANVELEIDFVHSTCLDSENLTANFISI